MGLFGKMFEKKTCSICGGEIGLLGNRKLEDGNLCKECAGKLSPFFSDRRASTVEQIAEQLEYREANRQKVAELNVTRTLGCDMKVMLDEDAKRFIVTRNSRWRDANPDVMDFSQVTGCDTEIRETRSELTWKDDEGHSQSYDPPRYDIDYDVYVTIHVNSPYFNEIAFKVNDYRIEERNSVEYREAERQAQQIREALTQLRETVDFLYSTGAAEVHMRSACPPIMYGCKYLNFSRSKSELDLITRRIILEKEGENAEKVLEEYADPKSDRYESMCQEICRRQNFTSLRYHRLDDLVESIGLPKCKMCTYCFDGKE